MPLPGLAEPLRTILLADFHVCRPWWPIPSLLSVVAQVNALEPDFVFLGGDFVVSHRMPAGRVREPEISKVLGQLRAKIGIYAVMGNHDWDDGSALPGDGGEPEIASALRADGIEVLINQNSDAGPLWIVGTDSQYAKRADGKKGLHDLGRALDGVPTGKPTLLLAHEPDIFADDARVPDLTLSGHTHAGQMNLFGWRPFTPSRYGGKYAYGHHEKDGKHLIVTSGFGYSGLPMRIGAAPEITEVTLVPA